MLFALSCFFWCLDFNMWSIVIFVFFSSVLKEMVRDLEQIKENGESQLIAKKDKCSSHANANGQHCKYSVIEVLRLTCYRSMKIE